MPAESSEYRFHIDVFTPDTLSMARLSEYLADLAILLGNKEHVHFLRVEEAQSTNLAYKIDGVGVPRTRKRLQLVKELSPDAPEDAVGAFHAINQKLNEDDTTARIESETEIDNLIVFPGHSHSPAEGVSELFGPITESGSIDGQIVRVGGFDKTIPVHMRSGKVHHYCTADEDMARKLGPYVLGHPVRVFGEGKWYRDENEEWKRRVFTILGFEQLEDRSLTESIARLRAIPGELQNISDPLERLNVIRHGPANGA